MSFPLNLGKIINCSDFVENLKTFLVVPVKLTVVLGDTVALSRANCSCCHGCQNTGTCKPEVQSNGLIAAGLMICRKRQ